MSQTTASHYRYSAGGDEVVEYRAFAALHFVGSWPFTSPQLRTISVAIGG
jgi:hypothetical protein